LVFRYLLYSMLMLIQSMLMLVQRYSFDFFQSIMYLYFIILNLIWFSHAWVVVDILTSY